MNREEIRINQSSKPQMPGEMPRGMLKLLVDRRITLATF